MQSVAGTLSRVNTVASALKRFLSRDDGRSNVTTPEAPPARSVSSASITIKPIPTGSMKITDQVIMEVDEQMTIQSQKPQDIRPTAQSVFANAPHTAPVDMPNAGQHQYGRAFSTGLPVDHNAVLPPGGIDAFLSVSAPYEMGVSANEFTPILDTDNKRISYGSQDSRSDSEPLGDLDFNLQADEFELLKARREQERIDKQKELFSRTISTQPPQQITAQLDTDLLLENLAAISSEQQQQQRSSPPPTNTTNTQQS